MRLLLLAPPGAGKGTQGERLAAWSGARHIETTGPLVPYYTERGILVAVNADQPPDSVAADIQALLSEPPPARLRRHGSGFRC